MGKRKIQTLASKQDNKEVVSLPNVWWRWKNEDEPDDIFVYTSDSEKQKKIKLQPAVYYSYPNGNAVHYHVKEGSKEQKELFSLLKLTDSDEKKIARKKRTTKKAS